MDWWTNAETFHASTFANDWGQNGHFDWATLAQSKFTFTTHCPIDKNFIDRCHQMGIRCFPYVSFYFGADHCQFGPINSNTYEGVDFSLHPDFIERDQQGKPKPWVFSNITPDGVGVTFSNPPLLHPPAPDLPYLMCPNYEPYQQKMIASVNYIMQQGADGIFVDNLLKRAHCYAQHPGPNPTPAPTPTPTTIPTPNQNHIFQDNPADPDAAQNQAFELLLSRVRQVVKSYQPDGLVLGNSGDPLNHIPGQSWPGFQQYLDADTLEGYVASGTSSWQGGLSWELLGRNLQAYLAQGKQVLAMSGFAGAGQNPPNPQFREDAFRAYCAARLAGLTWYCGPMNDPGVADLHRVRLGNALGAEITDPASQVNYRVFEHGIVAVNWDPVNTRSFSVQNSAAGTTPPTFPQNVQFFYDLYASPANLPIDISVTSGLLQVPANSGRVFLFGASTDYGLNRVSTTLAPTVVAA